MLARALATLLPVVAGCPEPGDEAEGRPAGAELALLAPGLHVLSPALPAPGATPEEAALGLLGDPPDLRVTSVRHSLTGVHVRLAPIAADGTPLLDGEVAVHLGAGEPGVAAARRMRSNVTRPIALAGARRFDADDAAERARAAALAAHPAREARVLLTGAVALPAGPGRARAGYRVVVRTGGPAHEWEVTVDGETGEASVRRDLLARVDGTGFVFQPNPVLSTGDDTLQDGNDADTPTLTSARAEVTLRGLDGSGTLRGEYADVVRKDGRTQVAGLVFDFGRSSDSFEEVNAYYHVDRVQRHLQALGFVGARGIQAAPFRVTVNAFHDDNSFYSPSDNTIEMGEGGVDDAEDGDIVAHEYGHAIAADVVPNFGGGAEAAALGEAISDLVAVLVPTGGPDLLSRACVGAWDATSYSPAPPPTPCLRRVDGVKHYPEHVDGVSHDDGEIWTGAYWEIVHGAGLGPADGLQLLVEALFLVSGDTTFAEAAGALLQADAELHGGAHEEALRRILTWRGLLADVEPAAPFGGPTERCPRTVESAHPIGDLHDEHVTIAQPGAEAVRVHFASFDMETDGTCERTLCDRVYLYDGAGRLHAVLGGALGAFDAPAVPGDTVIVRWVSDGSVGSPGFAIDWVDVVATTPGDGCAQAPPDAAPGSVDAAAAADAGPTPGGDAGPDGGDDGDGCACRLGARREGGAARGALAGGLAILGAALALRRRRRAPRR